MKFNFGRKAATRDITPQDVQARRAQGEDVVVLDVRQPEEYRHGHVAESTLIPLDQLALRLDELPKDRPVVAVCRSGNRSNVATGILKRAGFDALNVKGGMLAWEQANLPVERSQ